MNGTLTGLCRGHLTHGELPPNLDIWHLSGSLGALKADAFREKVEYGACLMLQDGHLSLVHQVRGDVDQVAPSCETPDPPHQDYVGFVHVHMPLPRIGRFVGFSHVDFRAAVADGANLSLVTNGEEVFALARAKDCTWPAQVVGNARYATWSRRYRQALAGLPDSVNRQLWEVNRELCRSLGFAFYRGVWGEQLTLVYQPSPGGIA